MLPSETATGAMRYMLKTSLALDDVWSVLYVYTEVACPGIGK